MITEEAPVQSMPSKERLSEIMAYQNSLLIRRYSVNEGVDEKIAVRHFQELKKFLVVCSLNTGGQRITPSRKLDEVWHTFILFTKDYREFCNRYFGKMIDHKPTLIEGKEQATVMMNGYMTARDRAQRIFNGDLDLEMWPTEPENLIADSGASSFLCEDLGGNC